MFNCDTITWVSSLKPWRALLAKRGVKIRGERPAKLRRLEGALDRSLGAVSCDADTEEVENDDDERGGSLASYAEWTAPDDGTYYLMVKAYSTETGTFGVVATPAGGVGSTEQDPCGPTGQTLEQRSASITYMPDGDYTDGELCHWIINCPAGSGNVQVRMTGLDTEQDYDFVNLYDGPDWNAARIDGMSGQLIDNARLDYASTTPSMTVEFASDESITAGGFQARFNCA